MKGSFTVEASLVFPFCFMVIGIVCFLGIFLYDQSVLKVTGYECIFETIKQEVYSEEQMTMHLQNLAEDAGKNRVLAISDLQAKVKISATKIIITYCGKQKFLNLPLEETIVYEKVFPELTLRLTRGKTGEGS